MKRIYQRLKINALTFNPVEKLLLATLIYLALSSSAVSQELVFKNPVLMSGTAGQVNAVYRFPNVSSGVDALVKVRSRSASNVIIENIDVTEFGWNKAFQPRLGISGGIVSGTKNWWMEFEFTFVKAGTTDKVEVNEFNVTSLDVDGDGLTIREYVEVYGANNYYCESGTELKNTSISDDDDDDDDDDDEDDDDGGKTKNYRILGPIKNYLDIDTAATKVMVTSKYLKKNQFKVKIGAQSMGFGTSNAAIRYNSIWFKSFNYKSVISLPVKLTSFTVKPLNDSKVVLNWTTEQEKNASHFTIEKSFNGKEFSDAGILFSIGNSELPKQYTFTDNLRTGEKGIIYYRLKMVDLDGRAQHSPVKVIRIDDGKANLNIRIFPNPVANDMSITLPTAWQDKKVSIDIFSTNGVLVKNFVTNNASQIETINVRGLKPGSYMVRTTAGTESSSHHIIKLN